MTEGNREGLIQTRGEWGANLRPNGERERERERATHEKQDRWDFGHAHRHDQERVQSHPHWIWWFGGIFAQQSFVLQQCISLPKML